MPIYIFSAAKKDGSVERGEREAADERALGAALRQEELLLLSAAEKGVQRSLLGRFSAIDFRALSDLIARFKSVSVVEKMFFSRNLAVMVEAGLPVTRAFSALAEESANPKFKAILADIQNSIVKGKSLAESMKAYENVFGELYINMIEVGEATGKLTTVLKLLANQMKKDHTLRRRVKGAMIYPAIILIAITIVASLMLIFVVPTLTATILELGVELPLSTRVVIAVSDILANYTLAAIAVVTAIGVLFWRLVLKNPRGKAVFDKIVLKLPIFGPLIQKMNVARFARILSYLITAGVSIVRSLEITANVLGNTLFRNAVANAAQEIQKGEPLSAILKRAPIFPPMIIHMVSVGEETGKISDMLLRIALFFEEDVSATTKNLSVIIEPILMVIIGAVVGFFVVSMLQPIYSSLGNIGI